MDVVFVVGVPDEDQVLAWSVIEVLLNCGAAYIALAWPEQWIAHALRYINARVERQANYQRARQRDPQWTASPFHCAQMSYGLNDEQKEYAGDRRCIVGRGPNDDGNTD